jgi:hypothetical protein
MPHPRSKSSVLTAGFKPRQRGDSGLPDRHRPQADRAGLHAGLDSAGLNQCPQRLVDGGIVLKIGPHVWVKHNCAIGQVEMLGFAGP